MRTVKFKSGILHVETPLGIVNIYAGPGVRDSAGREVISVELLPDRMAGEAKVLVRGTGGRFVKCLHAKGGR